MHMHPPAHRPNMDPFCSGFSLLYNTDLICAGFVRNSKAELQANIKTQVFNFGIYTACLLVLTSCNQLYDLCSRTQERKKLGANQVYCHAKGQSFSLSAMGQGAV